MDRTLIRLQEVLQFHIQKLRSSIVLPKIKTRVPGPQSQKLARRLKQKESRNVTFVSPDFPIFWEKSRGSSVWDVDGNCFLDFTAAFGVTSLGHGNANIVKAARDQMNRLFHVMGDVHPSRVKVELLERLSSMVRLHSASKSNPAQTILCNSGFEAVEAALKTSFRATGKRGVIAFENSYHGLGYGSLDATSLYEFRTSIGSQLSDFTTFLPFVSEGQENELRKVEKSLRSLLKAGKHGAILIEPAQGRGGHLFPAKGFLKMLRNVTDPFGTILIFDEIFTGFGRTGPLFAHQQEKVKPDLLCLGKALTSGFPLSACIGTRKLFEKAWPPSSGEALHTSTFLGHPVGCAMALASIREIQSNLQKYDVLEKGIYLMNHLRHLQKEFPRLIKAVRGRGLMLGIELYSSDLCSQAMVALLKKGIIILGGGAHHNVLTLSPPFVISRQEMDFFVQSLRDWLTQQADFANPASSRQL